MSLAQGVERPCTTCGVLVVGKLHVRTGNIAPIEVAPDRLGNIILLDDNQYMLRKGMAVPGALYYTNHYARCPQAKFWRERNAADVQRR